MENIPTLSREELQNLAARFGIEGAFDLKDEQLRPLLTQKAEEYRSYKSLIDGLDDRVAAIANLKGAAQDAANTLNFDEVETLLARVDEVETTIAAETKEARASNALLRNRPQQAYDIFCAAADSFREIDTSEYARRRNAYWSHLYNHGLRYGGPGLSLAANIIRPAIAALSDTEHKQDWASYTQNLAIALRNQGSRTEGPEGAALLADAVQAYRDALTVRTRADHPVQWAKTQQNLAIALETQGSRTEGPEGAALQAEAVQAFRAALTVRTREDQPVDWAMTQQNLAIALRNQGSRTEGPEGAALLTEAVQAYRDALTVRTREDHPVQWAMTQENLALAHVAIAQHDTSSGRRPPLETALEHVDAALTVFDPDNMPYNFNKATRLRTQIQAALDALPKP